MKDNADSQTPSLYANVRRICEERHITIAELERAAGLGNGVVRKWDKASPTLRTALAVARCLGVTLEELIAP